MLFQFIFTERPGETIFYPACKVAHPFHNKRVRIRPLYDAVSFFANFSNPCRFVITEGSSGASLAPGWSTQPYTGGNFAGQISVPSDQYMQQTIFASNFGPNPTQTNLDNHGYGLSTFDTYVTLYGPFLEITCFNYIVPGSDRINDITSRILAVDITPVDQLSSDDEESE